jgi:rod shape-determining protein MreD
MRSIWPVLILSVAFIAQISILPIDFSPDFVLITLLFLLITQGFEKIWIYLIVFSIFLDFYSGFYFGVISAGIIIAVYGCKLLADHVFGQLDYWTKIFLVLIGALIYRLTIALLNLIFTHNLVNYFSYRLFLTAVLEIFFDLIIFLFLYYGFKKISNKNYKFRKY